MLLLAQLLGRRVMYPALNAKDASPGQPNHHPWWHLVSFVCRNKNLGDGIDYGQQQYDCLGELISDTLALFEQRGGEDAFINIKYMVSVAWTERSQTGLHHCMFVGSHVTAIAV